MISFKTPVIFDGLSTTNLGKFKDSLRLHEVPVIDMSREWNSKIRQYVLVMWFHDDHAEDVFRRTLDGQLSEMVDRCAAESNMPVTKIH